MKNLFVVFFFFFLSWTVLSQGLVVNERNYASVPLLKNSEGSKNQNHELESTYDFSLREFCPTPQNQGNNANCVGWAVGYAAQTIREAYKHRMDNQESIDSLALSPYFIYNNIKLKDCNLGAEIPDALQFLIRTGNIPLNQFKEGKKDCFAQPNRALYEQANKYKINNFKKIFNPGDSRATKINAVKETLYSGYPVIIAMNISESFFEIEKGEDTWYSRLGSQVPIGGHALVVVGFDEIKNAFEVMNSWGTGWADNGFVWMNYDDFVEVVKYAFTFQESEEELFSIQINFNRNYLITADNEAHYNKELFRWDENKYLLSSTEYHPESKYEIEIFHSHKNYKIYCFNAGEKKTYSELFRLDGSNRQLTTNIRSFGYKLPALTFSDPVAEKFIFLISKNKISESVMERLHTTASIEEFKSIIYADLESASNYIHSYNRVGFTGLLAPKKPIIIPVEFTNKKDE